MLDSILSIKLCKYLIFMGSASILLQGLNRCPLDRVCRLELWNMQLNGKSCYEIKARWSPCRIDKTGAQKAPFPICSPFVHLIIAFRASHIEGRLASGMIRMLAP